MKSFSSACCLHIYFEITPRGNDFQVILNNMAWHSAVTKLKCFVIKGKVEDIGGW